MHLVGIRFILVMLLLMLTGCASLGIDIPFSSSSITPKPLPNPPANLTTSSVTTSANTVALLVPLQGSLANAGAAIRAGFLAAYQQAPPANRPSQIEVLDTSQGDINTVYQQAIKQGADFIVGPLVKSQVQTLSTNPTLPTTTLALNYLEPGQATPPNLYQFGLSPLDEARQVAGLARQSGYNSALIVVPNSNWGQSIANAYVNEWQALGGNVVATLHYSSNNDQLDSQLRAFLHFSQPANKKALPSRRHDFDVIFLAANPAAAREIRPLLKFYYAGSVPVYATSLVYTGVPQPDLDRDLDGITFCDIPWILNPMNTDANLRQQLAVFWGNNFQQNSRLFALGVDAYQVTTQLNTLLQGGVTLNGATGNLYLNEQHRIVRQLDCAQFQNGIPMLINQ